MPFPSTTTTFKFGNCNYLSILVDQLDTSALQYSQKQKKAIMIKTTMASYNVFVLYSTLPSAYSEPKLALAKAMAAPLALMGKVSPTAKLQKMSMRLNAARMEKRIIAFLRKANKRQTLGPYCLNQRMSVLMLRLSWVLFLSLLGFIATSQAFAESVRSQNFSVNSEPVALMAPISVILADCSILSQLSQSILLVTTFCSTIIQLQIITPNLHLSDHSESIINNDFKWFLSKIYPILYQEIQLIKSIILMEKEGGEFTELEDEVDFFQEREEGTKRRNLGKQENSEGLNAGQWAELPEDEEIELPEKREVKMEEQVELKKFQTSKIAISRLADRKMIQEVQMIPCPFCALSLTLEQLDHISQCEQGRNCSFCKEKYPSTLYGAHLMVCVKMKEYQATEEKKRPKKQQIVQNKKEKIEVVKPERRIFQVKKEPLKKEPAVPRRINNLKYYRKQVPTNNHVHHSPEVIRNYDLQSKIRQEQLKGLKDYEIDNIPMEEYFPIGQQDTSCVICTSEVSQGDPIIRLSCNHFFHIDCLRPWLSSQSRCPTCKASVRP